MVEAVTRALCRLLLLVLLAFPSAVFAHRDDEYLQATLVAIKPSGVRLQINLTPGVAVAEQVIAEIDRDRDGAISKNEAAAYAELLKRDLALRMDGRDSELKLTASEFVPPAELRTGAGTIQMEFSAIFSPLAAGPHRLTFENRHLTTISVYLINAAQPRFATVQITRQKRNENQSAGEIEFNFHPFRQRSLNPVRGLEWKGRKQAGQLRLCFRPGFLETVPNSHCVERRLGLSIELFSPNKQLLRDFDTVTFHVFGIPKTWK
jgi:hypothetical protein